MVKVVKMKTGMRHQEFALTSRGFPLAREVNSKSEKFRVESGSSAG
jgi:hypothetical protein